MSDPIDDPKTPTQPEQPDRRTLVKALELERKPEPADDWAYDGSARWNDAIDRAIELVDEHFDRINAVLDARVADGKKAAGLDPYGYRTDPETGKLVEHVTEQTIINIVVGLRQHSPDISLRSIATYLWDHPHNFKNRKGRKFEPTQIARILLADAAARARERLLSPTDPDPETE